MKLLTRYCPRCLEDTEQCMLGMIPGHMVSGKSGDWAKATLCTECGSVAPIEPDEDDLRRGERRVVETMLEFGLISAEQAGDIV